MSRDISWGADCDACETRVNAGRAEQLLRPDGSLLCGSCLDEMKYAELRDVAKAVIEAYMAGYPLMPSMCELERVAGLRQQVGS